jgi:hypothetical protein
MKFSFRVALWSAAALMVGLGMGRVLPACEAQKRAPAPAGRTIPAEVNIPGVGLVRGRLRLLPPTAMRRRQGPGRETFSFADPVLFSSFSDYDSDGAYGDPLWSFPTLGYDLNHIGQQGTVPNTLEGGIPGAPAPPVNANFAEVYYGQLGTQARLTTLSMVGGMVNINTLAYEPGLILILFFNGVDAATPPQPNSQQAGFNLALTEQGDLGYLVLVPDPGGFASIGIYDIDFDPENRLPISNAQGKFGVLVAKYYDPNLSSGGNVQWVGATNSPNGPNRVYRLTNIQVTATGATATITPRTQAANAAFNQSATGTTNYFYEIRGNRYNADPTQPPRGTLFGNIRRRGVDLPDPNTPESAPGFYRIAAFNASNQLVREDFVFTQPSYDDFGDLTINYKLEGYPAGTYTIEVSQRPIFNAMGADNIVWTTTRYPFSDSLPSRQTVTVTNIYEEPFEPTELNVRLERFGDIDNGSGNGIWDGSVDVLDLAALIAAFDSVEGDSNFLASADLAGGGVDGRPDGSVDVLDLAVLIQTFDTGTTEVP